MLCPSCKNATTETQRYCNHCGQFAPGGDWFLNNASFIEWTPTEEVINRVPRAEKQVLYSMRETTSSSEKKQERISVRPGNINRFSYAKNYPILYVSKRKKGNGKTEDAPFAVTVYPIEAQNGTIKTIPIIDLATGVRKKAELDIPAGVKNGRLLKMENGNQILFVAIYIESLPDRFEKISEKVGIGCAGSLAVMTVGSVWLVNKGAFWFFIMLFAFVLIFRKKDKTKK